MPQPNVDEILSRYTAILQALRDGKDAAQAFKYGVQAADAIATGGIAAAIGEAVINYMISKLNSYISGGSITAAVKRGVFFIALTVEYANRTGEIKMLTNRCKKCHQLGHNTQNCLGRRMIQLTNHCVGASDDSDLEALGQQSDSFFEDMDSDCNIM